MGGSKPYFAPYFEQLDGRLEALPFRPGGVVGDLLDALVLLRQPRLDAALLLDNVLVEVRRRLDELGAVLAHRPTRIVLGAQHQILAHLDLRQDLRPHLRLLPRLHRHLDFVDRICRVEELAAEMRGLALLCVPETEVMEELSLVVGAVTETARQCGACAERKEPYQLEAQIRSS
jgi:hypothetical protein